MKSSELTNYEVKRIQDEFRRREREMPKDFYSLEHPGNLFHHLQRMRRILEVLRKMHFFPLKNKKILEVGCGTGDWLADFESWGADQDQLSGIDLDQIRIEKAKFRMPRADIKTGDASELPWPDGIFDIILQPTVFTTILEPVMKQRIAKEMLRVLKPDGLILWYDFFWNNPNNVNVRKVGKNEIRNLFPDCHIEFQTITLAPPIARRLANYSWLMCYMLEQIRFLNTHYLAVIKHH